MLTRTPRTGTVYRFRSLTFYAIEGLVAMHDARPEALATGKEYAVVLPEDLLERARLLHLHGAGSQASVKPHVREDGRSVSRAAAEMAACAREAKYMGDPSDPDVQEYWRKHHKRPVLSIGPGGVRTGYPVLPPIGAGVTARSSVLPDNPRTNKLTQQIVRKAKAHQRPVRKT